jgi:hypothetical protein
MVVQEDQVEAVQDGGGGAGNTPPVGECKSRM